MNDDDDLDERIKKAEEELACLKLLWLALREHERALQMELAAKRFGMLGPIK